MVIGESRGSYLDKVDGGHKGATIDAECTWEDDWYATRKRQVGWGDSLVLMATRESEPQGQTSLEWCVVEAISTDSALQRCSVVLLDSRYVLSGFPRYARLTEQCPAGFRNQWATGY